MMSDNDSSASGYVTDAFEGINREFTDVASAIGIEKVEDLGNCIVMEDTNGNRKLLKRRHEEKIDNVAAMMDAFVAFKLNKEAFE